MPNVNIPGVGRVGFPDTMNPDALRAAVQDVYRQGQEKQSRAASGLDDESALPKLAAVAGAPAMAYGLGAALPAGLATGVGRLLTSPIGRTTIGGYVGEELGGRVLGQPGRVIGGLLGAGGGLRSVGGLLRTATPVAEAAARPAADALANMGRQLILSPADAARKARLMTLAKQEASEAGTVAAGRQARGGSLLEQLFGP